MPMKPAPIYGSILAAAKQALNPLFYLQLATAVQGIIVDSPVSPLLGSPPMTVPPPLLSPTPLIGAAVPKPNKIDAVYGAQFAVASGAPPTVAFYADACAMAMKVVSESRVLAVGTLVAPPGGGPVVGIAKVTTARPAAEYGAEFALKSKCPPGSTQAKHYTDIAQLVLDMLRDAQVSGFGLIAPPGGGPIAGAAFIS